MSKDVVKDNSKVGIDEFIAGVHKYFGDRLEKIENRFNAIEGKLSEVQQGDSSKVRDFGKAKNVAKKAMATAAKTAIDVELLASQEEAIGDIDLDGLGLLDRLKRDVSSKDEITEDEGHIIAEIAAKMRDEFSRKLDTLEKRIDALYEDIDISKDGLEHEISNPSKRQDKAESINNLSKAYQLINEMYEDLTKRFDSLEKKLDKIEREIDKNMPDIELENSKADKSVIGKAVNKIKGLFRNNKKADAIKDNKVEADKINFFPDDLDDFTYDLMEGVCGKEHMTFERETNTLTKENAADLGSSFEGEEPKPLKKTHDYYNKGFEFTSYDANIVFGCINESNGMLRYHKLRENLEKIYKTKEEVDKQLLYLEGRIDDNVEAGYLEIEENGRYVITDKGKKAAAKIKLKKNKQKDIAL